MYSITVEDNFSAAHNLRNYKGKCEKLHGHNYRVYLTVGGSSLDKSGMLSDFSYLKNVLENILSELDHAYLNRVPPFNKINPTAENIAEFIFTEAELKIKNKMLKVERVKVWETEKNCAEYYEK
ncbi:MAG TPA: 6-carboxytetrahydropterin synthase QueD [Elusimicrobia bacterium]|nr:6-carboxytetrahydropterin synthase QueD [Elusimicrobiota bacterium]